MKPSEKPIDRVDQFFKNKLDDHTIAPSENAWAKVEAGLSKKNNVVLWRWAAAVFLMGALISIVYWSQKGFEKPQSVLAEKKVEAKKLKSMDTSNAKAPVSKTIISATKGNTNPIAKSSAVKIIVPQTKITSEDNHEKETIVLLETNKQPVIDKMNQNKIEEKINTEATPIQEVASTHQKPIKLEFTLEDLPSVETVATTNEAKNTGLKKVLELAREIKQGEGPLANLREKKNELFAHNFITGKERTQ